MPISNRPQQAHARPDPLAADRHARATHDSVDLPQNPTRCTKRRLSTSWSPQNPIVVKPGLLPKKREKDPTWRSQATYTTAEVVQLITDPRIPVERRVR